MSLLALKFVVEVILLYTPDPSVSTEPPACEGSCCVLWLCLVHHCSRGLTFFILIN